MTLMSTQPTSGDIPTPIVIIINSTFQATYIFVMILIGLRLQKRTGLDTPILNRICLSQCACTYFKKVVNKWYCCHVNWIDYRYPS